MVSEKETKGDHRARGIAPLGSANSFPDVGRGGVNSRPGSSRRVSSRGACTAEWGEGSGKSPGSQ